MIEPKGDEEIPSPKTRAKKFQTRRIHTPPFTKGSQSPGGRPVRAFGRKGTGTDHRVRRPPRCRQINDVSVCRQSPFFAVPSNPFPRPSDFLRSSNISYAPLDGFLRRRKYRYFGTPGEDGPRTGLATLRPLPHIPGSAGNRATHMARRNYGRRKSRGRVVALGGGGDGTLGHSAVSRLGLRRSVDALEWEKHAQRASRVANRLEPEGWSRGTSLFHV